MENLRFEPLDALITPENEMETTRSLAEACHQHEEAEKMSELKRIAD